VDRASFDRIARTLAGAATRRDGFRALIGAAVAVIGAGGGAVVDAAPNGQQKRRAERAGASKKPSAKGKPSAQGPCGNGKRKDNICTSDGDCCTGICNLGAGKKNKDRRGRCRCMKRNKPCTADVNCCNTLTCNQGRCSMHKPGPTPPKPAGKVPTGSGCTQVDTCASELASCTTYTSNAPRGSYCLLPDAATCSAAEQCVGQVCNGGVCGKGLIPTGEACTGGDTCASAGASCVSYGSSNPAGTYCLRANGAACDGAGDCVSQICIDEVCSAVAETCDVCPTCTYTTVQAAIDGVAAGSTIRIDEGFYEEDLIVDKDLRLKACNGAKVFLYNSSDGSRTISRADNGTLVSLTISDISVGAADKYDFGGGIFGWFNLTLNGTTKVADGRIEQAGGCIELGSGNFDVDWDNDIYNDGTVGACTLTIADKAQVTNCTSGWAGGNIWMGCIGGTITMSGDASVTSGAAGDDGGGIWTAGEVSITLADRVLAGGCYAGDDGGAIFASERSTLRMSGTATVLGNRSGDDGGGIATDSYTELDMSGQSVIAENTSNWSGGGFVGGCYGSVIRMSGEATIRDNTAVIAGGGAYLQGAPSPDEGDSLAIILSMKGSAKIHGNATVDESDPDDPYPGGAGVHVSDNVKVELEDQASIYGNETPRVGGGIWSASDVILKGTSSIRDNKARQGGGVYLAGPVPWDPEDVVTPIKLKVASTAKVSGNNPDQCVSTGEASC
jgi:predicted outer membrane repeat protein